MRKYKIGSIALGFAVAVSAGYIMTNQISANDDIDNASSQQDSSVSDNLIMNIDENGNVVYEEATPGAYAEAEVEIEEPDYEIVKTLGDSEEVVATYDDYNKAKAELQKRSFYRSAGSLSLRASNLNSVQYGVVNFNGTQVNACTTLNYTDANTGRTGYLNRCSGSDAAYLGTMGNKIKFKQAGIVGLVDNDAQVEVVEYDSIAANGSINSYKPVNGRLIHYVTSNIMKTKYSSIDNGPMPSFMQNGTVYYSYDGHYFYTDYKMMINDYKNNTYAHSINPNNPYYNYFQYLSHRTKTNFTAAQFDSKVASMTDAASKMRNMGSYFISNQNTYGANALLVYGLAVNESGWGASSIAKEKNNLFGHNAVDSSPGLSADAYTSPQASILDHAKNYVSRGYLDPADWRYNGSALGDKQNGMNVKYASDPYWGEKAAQQGYVMENYTGNKNTDYGKYTLGIVNDNVNVRLQATTGSKTLYTTKNASSGNSGNYPLVILGEVQGESINGNSLWYKIQTDAPIVNGNVSIEPGTYDYGSSVGYIHSSYVKIVNTGSNTNSNYMLGDVNNDGKISAIDYVMVENHIINKYKLSGKGFTAADINRDGKVSAIDYVMIENHITGKYLIR